ELGRGRRIPRSGEKAIHRLKVLRDGNVGKDRRAEPDTYQESRESAKLDHFRIVANGATRRSRRGASTNLGGGSTASVNRSLFELARPAGGRNDAVHAQVDNHLAVVIVGVKDDEADRFDAGGLTFGIEGIGNGLGEVGVGKGGDGFVGVGEGILQVFDDVFLLRHVGGTVVIFGGRHG